MRPALAAVLFAVLLSIPALAHAEPTFTLTGRGWGHGIGMSQYGARAYAEHGAKYDAILRRYYQGTSLGTIAAKTVRVAIDKDAASKSSYTLRANTSYLKFQQPDGYVYSAPTGGAAYTVSVYSGDIVEVKRASDGALMKRLFGPVLAWEYGNGMVEVVTPSGPQVWSSVVYKGQMRLHPYAGKIYCYNHVSMEDYVRGVAPRETPASWHQEALKAQCVAARSYAYVSLRSASYDYDVFCTTRSQVYNGYGRASGGTVTRHSYDYLYDTPVAATANQVVKYGSTVVQTFFFSTSGGYTENIETVWPGATPQPYYRAVKDEWEYTAGSPYHEWPEKTNSYTATALRTKLLTQFSSSQLPGKIVDVQITSRGTSGRVKSILLKGAAGDDKVISHSQISSFKSALGMRDKWFYFTGFEWGVDSVYLEPGAATAVPFKVTPPVSGTITCFVVRFPNGTTQLASGTVSNGSGWVTVPSGAAGIRIDSAALLPNTDMRGHQGYFYGPELGVTSFTETERIAGKDRYATSVAASKRSFPGTATTVVVASGVSPADALAGSALAGAVPGDAPILLTPRDGMTPDVLAEIARLKPTKAYVLGGTASVGAAVETQLRGVSTIGAGGVERIAGPTRYATSRLIANKVASLLGGSYDGRAIAVNGEVFADAVAASPLAFRSTVPVLLVNGSGVPSETLAAISDIGVTETLVVGGSGAVPDSALPSLPGSHRIAAGSSRYHTAALVADWCVANEGFSWGDVYIASGASFADPLSAGPLSGRAGRPLLFVTPTAVPADTQTRVAAHKATIGRGYILGGSAAVSNGCRAVIEDALR